MYVYGYLRASTKEQDASRAKAKLKKFIEDRGGRIASWYIENVSGASLLRPALMQLLDDAAPGDVILIEQVDRLSRLDDAGWSTLKQMIQEKSLYIISLDLPTSHVALSQSNKDEFTVAMLKAINNMMLDMLAAIARKDYQDRRRRQSEGILKAKGEGKYRGRQADKTLHDKIIQLRIKNGMSIVVTAKLVGVSTRTVIRVCKQQEQLDAG